ncbi:hypothetical protein V5R04_07280 [Jonesiaceae bacterium BS-20]|uniref:Uncharacterized protein n=1 Tax=Jonesiaceae bacterium BS-20 TaxID=3120821 RepID=A0AAU7DZ74_9MICO
MTITMIAPPITPDPPQHIVLDRHLHQDPAITTITLMTGGPHPDALLAIASVAMLFFFTHMKTIQEH